MGDKKLPKGDYPVGYCTPPKATQFKKGQSGNPRGRKKRAPLLDENELTHLLTKPVVINTAGISREVSPIEAQVQSMIGKALKKNLRCMEWILKRASKYGLLPALPPDRQCNVVYVVDDHSDEAIRKHLREMRAFNAQ